MVVAGSERARSTGLASLGLALVLLATTGASCRTRPDDCRHKSIERCKWEQAVNETEGAPASDEDGANEAGTDDPNGVAMTETEQNELDATLDQMIEIMAGGLEWSLTDARARTICRERNADDELVAKPVTLVDPDRDAEASPDKPEDRGDKPDKPKPDKPKSGPKPEVWRCALDWLRINEVPLVLEASAGVISLSAQGLAGPASESIAAFAEARFGEWCARAFERVESSANDDIRRCDLSAGPYLVIARFPSDAEARSWQVSIAVVDAG